MNLEDKLIEKNNSYTISHLFKIIIISLIILLVIESIAVIFLINRKPRIVVIDTEGVPIESKENNKDISNIINTKQFLIYFLNQLYDYNAECYVDKIRGAMPLMTKSLKEQYLNEIETGGYIEQVNKYDITSSLNIKRISEDIQQVENGYMVTVNASKLKITDFIDRNIDVNITIGYRPTNFSNTNIWGLEVFYIREENL